MNLENKLITRAEAAEYLGISVQTLADWATTKRYQLPMIKVGRLVKYRLSDIEAFLDIRTRNAFPLEQEHNHAD